MQSYHNLFWTFQIIAVIPLLFEVVPAAQPSVAAEKVSNVLTSPALLLAHTQSYSFQSMVVILLSFEVVPTSLADATITDDLKVSISSPLLLLHDLS